MYLLQHMFDPRRITKTEFKLLLEYLEGLKGKSRNECIEKAREIEKEEELSEDSSEDEKKLQRIRKTRALNILRVLL